MKFTKTIQIALILFFSASLFAQSDYRITQEFKSRHRSFEIAIEYAKTLDELDKIRKEINEFKNEFKGNVELLNRALYPGNFESSFQTLDAKIEYTNKKLTEIYTLQTKVEKVESDYIQVSSQLSKLTDEVNVLRRSNSRLMEELRAFQSGYGGSKESIDSLNNLISELRYGISKRDTLIKEIMDNIFMTAEHRIESLDDAERQNLRANIQGVSLIDNIRNLINDNIAFLDASLLNLDDLKQLKTEFTEFEDRWNHFGPQLFAIYSTDVENKDKLNKIDTLIVDWDSSLTASIWKSIHNIFTEHKFELDNFRDNIEFENVIISFIDERIEGQSSDGEISGDHNFVIFSERVWNEIIKTQWMPFLLSNKLFEEQQILTIDNKLVEWKDSIGSGISYLVYGLILFLAIVIVITFILIKRRKAKTTFLQEEFEPEVRVRKKKNEGEITIEDEFIDDNKD